MVALYRSRSKRPTKILTGSGGFASASPAARAAVVAMLAAARIIKAMIGAVDLLTNAPVPDA
jgi:hypothetical protein